jgi:hypothetical protein
MAKISAVAILRDASLRDAPQDEAERYFRDALSPRFVHLRPLNFLANKKLIPAHPDRPYRSRTSLIREGVF